MSDAVVKITDRARAVLAFATELERVDALISDENDRHRRTMEVLQAQRQVMQQAILQFGGSDYEHGKGL